MSSITYGSLQSSIYRLLVITFSKSVIGAMWHVISLRRSCLLSKHAVALRLMVLMRLYLMLFAVIQDTSTCLILTYYPNGFITDIINRRCLWVYKPLHLGRNPFSVVLDLNSRQKVTPFLMKYGTIILVIILQLVLHGWGGSLLSCNVNSLLAKLFFADVPTSWLKITPFVEGGARYFARLCISQTRSAYWRILTLKGFTISLWMYLTWSWKTL